MTASSASADVLTICEVLALLGRRGRCPAGSSVMPMMPFMGVRISWLMLARNSLLARLAASAASLAARSSAADPGVLQGERGLVGERLGHPYLVGLEAAVLRSADGEGADRLVPEHDRDGEHGGEPTGWRRCRTSWVSGILGSFRTSSDSTGRRSRTATPDAPVPRGSRTPRASRAPETPDRRGPPDRPSGVGAIQGGHAGVEEPADALDDPLGDLVRVQRLRDDAADLGEALGRPPPASASSKSRAFSIAMPAWSARLVASASASSSNWMAGSR